MISIRELLSLLSEPASEGELAEAIEAIPYLKSRFELRAGFLTERTKKQAPDSVILGDIKGRATARANMRFAVDFVRLLRSPFKMVAVSGSTSYRSASKSKDLDFFSIAHSGRVWVALTQGLLLARVYSVFHRDSPQICLSCNMDENYARSVFGREQGPLFARDALAARVLKGTKTYLSLLNHANWISSIYPTAYMASATRADDHSELERAPTIFGRMLNRFLYLTVGTYIKAKSKMLSRRLERSGLDSNAFVVRSSERHLLYESKRYTDLRKQYSVGIPRQSEANH
jgi:hypothetical protein